MCGDSCLTRVLIARAVDLGSGVDVDDLLEGMESCVSEPEFRQRQEALRHRLAGLEGTRELRIAGV